MEHLSCMKHRPRKKFEKLGLVEDHSLENTLADFTSKMQYFCQFLLNHMKFGWLVYNWMLYLAV